MPTFHTNEMRIFDRAGNPLGSITGWSVEQPRSYRFNEIEDFTFNIPQRDLISGEVYLTDDVVDNLLREDNLIYVANQLYGMRGWAGQIGVAQYHDYMVTVPVIGMASLFQHVETEVIAQDDGDVWTIAERLVLAANAKQGAHGDLVVGFEHDETGTFRRNFGHYSFEGDILSGLQSLAGQTVSEWFIHSRVGSDGHLVANLRWGGQYVIDHTDLTLEDGPGGIIAPGTVIQFSSTDTLNHIRIRGVPTDLGQYVDYESIRSVLRDVTPEVSLSLSPDGDFHRLREDLNIDVAFGYSVATEQALAGQIQEKYLGFFKTFLYAYHNRMGKPFLDGYDWPGPNGRNDKRLTTVRGRYYNRLAFIGHRTVILGSTDDDDSTIEAEIDDWSFSQTLSPVGGLVGVATNWIDPDTKFLADSDTGAIYELDEDLITTDLWQTVAGSGETLRSVATDPARATTLWVLVTTGSAAIVRQYDSSEKTLISEWTVAVPSANDIAVDAGNGVLWMVAADGVGNVQARDINSGVLLTTGDFVSFASGFTNPVGLSVSGGVAYVINASGAVRMLFTDGDFAGSKSTGSGANGIFVDEPAGLIWLLTSGGDASLYHAHVAVASAGGDGIVEGAPGFEAISAGQFVHVVFNTKTAQSPHTTKKVLICYSPGRYVTRSEPTEPGQPDVLQRTWVTGNQHVAWLGRKRIHWTTPEQVIQGEESRVDEWSPKENGYGYFGRAHYRSKRGDIVRYGKGWFFKDWDIPDAEFQPDPPEWTEGLAYAQDFLARNNQRKTTQVLNLVNAANVFTKIVLGGLYNVAIHLQGPPTGFTGVLRVLSYTPDEQQGTMQIIGEWWS